MPLRRHEDSLAVLLKFATALLIVIGSFKTVDAQPLGVLAAQCIQFSPCYFSSSPIGWNYTVPASSLARARGTQVSLTAVQTSVFTVRLGPTTLRIQTPGGVVVQTLGEFSGNFHQDPCNPCEVDTIGTFSIPADAQSAVLSGTFGNSQYPNSSAVDVFLGIPESTCIAGAVLQNVGLPEVTVSLPFPVKPWQIRYAGLGLNFSVRGETIGGGCFAESSTSTLQVLARLRLVGIEPFVLFAFSTATATLETFPPSLGVPASTDQLLDGPFDPSANYIRWHTEGFQTQFLTQDVSNSGPITAWLNLERQQLSPTSHDFEAIVRGSEPIIHRLLIKRLPQIASYTVFQDPGRVSILAIDSNNRATGYRPDGVLLTQIPRAFYYQSDTNPAVVLPNTSSGRFGVSVTGLETGDFSLAVSTANLVLGTIHESTFDGTIAAGSTIVFDVLVQSNDEGAISTALTFDRIASLSLVIAFVETSELSSGVKNSLLMKLRNVREHLGSNRQRDVTGALGAVINEVSAQAGKKISNEIATALNNWIGDLLKLYKRP